MLVHRNDELCSRLLMEINHPSPDEGVIRAAEFRQIEREWDLALKPGLNCMPVGRNHVDQIGTGQGIDMQVCQLCKCSGTTRMSGPNESGQQDGRESDSNGHRPNQPAAALGARHLFLHLAPKLRTRRKMSAHTAEASLQSGHLRNFRCAVYAASQMFLDNGRLIRKKLTIQIGAEHRGNGITLHGWTSLTNLPVMPVEASFGHVTGATSLFQSVQPALPQSPYRRALPCHSAKSFRGKGQVIPTTHSL